MYIVFKIIILGYKIPDHDLFFTHRFLNKWERSFLGGLRYANVSLTHSLWCRHSL